MTEDEMVGWHHQLDGHEFEQAPEGGDGQALLIIVKRATGAMSPLCDHVCGDSNSQ